MDAEKERQNVRYLLFADFSVSPEIALKYLKDMFVTATEIEAKDAPDTAPTVENFVKYGIKPASRSADGRYVLLKTSRRE